MGPGGILISKFEFYDMVADGCVSCSDNILISEAESLMWTKDNKPLCPDCQDMLELNDYSYGWLQ